jgi:hypothetical protein
MTEIAPVLAATVPRVIIPIGSEDADELVQDALTEACKAADSLERRNRPVPSSSIVYYAIQRLKAGRRFMQSGRTDVMSPGCRLDGRSVVESLEAPFGTDDEGGELCLGDVLASKQDDPACRAVRGMDWSAFVATLTPAQQQVVCDTAAGYGTKVQAQKMGISCPRITEQKRTIGKHARKFWGESVLQDAIEKPLWRKTRYQ